MIWGLLKFQRKYFQHKVHKYLCALHHLLPIIIKITLFFLKLFIRDLPKILPNISTLSENQRSEIHILLNGKNVILFLLLLLFLLCGCGLWYRCQQSFEWVWDPVQMSKKKLFSHCLLLEHRCSESYTLFTDVNKCLLLKITHLFSNFVESRLKMVVEQRLAKSGATKFVLLIWA